MIPEALTPLAAHLWQSTLFAVMVGLLTLALRRNQARVRYWLWLAASYKFLLPFAWLVSVGHQFEWRSAAVTVPPAFSALTDMVSGPIFLTSFPAAKPAADHLPALLLVIWAIWGCGFVVVAAGWAREWLRMRALVRAASPLSLGLPIRVVSTQARLEPGVFGIFRPVLLLPEGIAARLTQGQLQSILAHELCHVRRRDNLTAAVHMLVEGLFWFHPLLWWLGARLIDEREAACDEEVLQSGSQAQVYAESILKVCEFYLESPLTCMSGVTGSDLKKRIRRIMKNRFGVALSARKKLLLATAGVVALALPVVAGVLTAPRLGAQSSAVTADRPKFDAASIKQNKSGNLQHNWSAPGGFYRETNGTLRLLVAAAYFGDAAKGRVVLGGPGWIDSERFDIEARAEGSPGIEQKELMLQSLLEDRFKLAMHHESRQIPLFALVLSKSGKLGLQLNLHSDATKCFDLSADQRLPLGRGAAQHAPCGGLFSRMDGSGKATMVGSKITMERLVAMLNIMNVSVDRLIVDRTGLSGAFDLKLEYNQTPVSVPDPSSYLSGPSQSGPAQPNRDPSGAPLLDLPSFLTAMQDQLGLKLEPEKGPVDVLVIDHAEEPSPN
jgi:bla regulator protein BlaR1